MLILRVNLHAQKFPVDFEPAGMYSANKNKNKRLWAVEWVRNYEDKPTGAVRAVIV